MVDPNQLFDEAAWSRTSRGRLAGRAQSDGTPSKVSGLEAKQSRQPTATADEELTRRPSTTAEEEGQRDCDNQDSSASESGFAGDGLDQSVRTSSGIARGHGGVREAPKGGASPEHEQLGDRSDERGANAPPIHRYVDGNAYRAAVGRSAAKAGVVDTHDWRSAMAVIDLRRRRPGVSEFVRLMVREMRIRSYRSSTVKSYRDAITSLLRWSGRQPHEITREMVREYLEYLVDSRKGSSMLSVHLAAIRTVFDKMCFMDITLGICTPRRGKHLPTVLSKDEVCRLLEAAPSFRDKLLLGLMYATGMRVSEVVRLRWRDIDLDRNVISIRSGKGDVDRQVMLPNAYRKLFAAMMQQASARSFLFPSEDPRRSNDLESRYLSSRTVQRVMSKAVRLARVGKSATPHSLRHSFATHSFEGGCDIRRIQKILGHVHLETTTIYVKVAKPSDPTLMPSPIDHADTQQHLADMNRLEVAGGSERLVKPKIHFRRFAGEDVTRVTLEFASRRGPVYLPGGRAQEIVPGYWTLQVPPVETWLETNRCLGRVERRQLQSAELHDWLRVEVGRRLAGNYISRVA